MATPTLWPLRQALSPTLRNLISTYGLPAINAALAAQFPAITGAAILQFTDSTLVMGEIPGVSGATLELDIIDERTTEIASNEFKFDFTTQITLKIAQAVGSNSPEQIKFIGDCVCDNLRDVMTSGDSYGIIPIRPDGTQPLPPGSSFQDCYISRIVKPPWQRSAEGVLRMPTWYLYHRCFTTLFMSRPGALGG